MFIKSLHLKNILSFRDTKLDLQPLNVLIGPNGSGKSNLIDVIGLLQAVPGDLAGFLRRNGPIWNWVWDGKEQSLETQVGFPEFEAILADHRYLREPLRYGLKFAISKETDHFNILPEQYNIHSEILEIVDEPPNEPRAIVQWDRWYGMISDGESSELGDRIQTPFTAQQIRQGRSVLSEFRDPLNYHFATIIARRMAAIRLYRDWTVSRTSSVRHPQRTDGDPNFLEEDFSNLALVINDLLSRRLEPSLNDYLKRFYESHESLSPERLGEKYIQLTVNETGMSGALPASRLSDGTIRFIALLAILCHPDPPPLICIEEPEIAMHPDSLDLVVELLRKASERTQLIVTTHSPWLIDRLSAKPEQVVVCERDSIEGTQFKRFSREELGVWLEDQPLGEVWMAGAMGGVR